MNRITCSALTSALLLSACGNETTTPAATPAKAASTPAAAPAKPAEIPVKPAETPAKPAPSPVATPAETPKPPPVETPKPSGDSVMDAAIQVLMAKAEQPDASIEIQHILISFEGAPRMHGVTRNKAEAKVLAEKVYAEVIGGGDFDALVKQYTNDSAPGIYPLDQNSRKGMVKSFGDVGWRLKVGEIGVAPWDAKASPFGWHIIKRLK